MSDCSCHRGESALAAFLLGGIVGAVLGILFAPRSGKENREVIAAKAKEYWGEGVEFYETGREKVTDAYSAGKEKASGAAEELKTKIDAARERLREQADTVKAEAKDKVAEVAPTVKEKIHKVGEAVKSGVDVAEEKSKEVLDKLAGGAEAAEPETPPLT